MKLFRLEWMVFLAAFTVLSWNLWNVGIASGSIDPILHFGAQDEATYTREAITMARDGGWMTPTFLGRWIFEKPPLLMWLSALSMKAFGIGRFPARLPSVLAGALVCLMCFLIVRRERSVAAALAASAMALSSQILFIMARHNMTDILFAAAGLCAFAFLLRDPALDSPRFFTGFVAAAAAAILAKSIAGLLVLAVMIVVTGFGRGRLRPASLAAASSILLASPWFLYNFITHRQWFLADMGFQIVTIGTAAHQTAQENHLLFYILRILNSDLIPLVLALTALPALTRGLRRRHPAALLAASYFVIYFAALMIFHFHSEQYLTWFVPCLILIAGLYSPLLHAKGAAVACAVILLAFVVKLASPDRVFCVSMRSGTTIGAAPLLSRYCQEARATDLYVVGVDDEFYSAVLPLHRVRYGWIDPSGLVAREHPHLAYLGILLPAATLPQLERNLPLFRDRLRAWGLDSTQAVATGLAATDPSGLLQILYDHPEADFLIGRTLLPDAARITTHHVTADQADFVLLESNQATPKAAPAWSCEM